MQRDGLGAVARLTGKRRRGVRLALVGSLGLLFLLSIGSRGCWQQARVRLERRRIEAEIRELEAAKARLEAEKKRLQDPATVERLAREKYGMSGKDETVYRVVPGKKK
jgi:cell division protein FtsL